MSDEEPWHRAYRRLTWGEERPPWPTGWVPPQERFGDAVLKQVLPASPSLSVGQRLALRQDLRDIAEDYLTVALTTPLGVGPGASDAKLSARFVWVRDKLFAPADDLLKALSDDSAPMRSGWPDLLDAAGPNRKVLIRELETLREYAKQLAWNLESRAETTVAKAASKASRGANHTEEFRLDLAHALRNVFARTYPGLAISRGTYVPGEGFIGQFPAFLNGCFKEILGEAISDHLVRRLTAPMKDNGEVSGD